MGGSGSARFPPPNCRARKHGGRGAPKGEAAAAPVRAAGAKVAPLGRGEGSAGGSRSPVRGAAASGL